MVCIVLTLLYIIVLLVWRSYKKHAKKKNQSYDLVIVNKPVNAIKMDSNPSYEVIDKDHIQMETNPSYQTISRNSVGSDDGYITVLADK